MTIRWASGVLGGLLLFCAGCAICCGPYDYHYPNYGGSVQRSDPEWGRVGSIYSDPGPFGGPLADYNLQSHKSRNSTEQTDELEPLEQENSDDLTPPGNVFDGDPNSFENNGSGNRNGDLLPPPKNDDLQRPSPDDSTSIRRLRNQSRRPVRRWR